MVGKIFGSRYEVLERIGNGGMSLVYRARDITLNRLVAVKILKHQWAEDDEVVHRFDQEARAAASLVNRHIVQIYDVGREDPDIHYMVMELVAGETLRSKLDREPVLSIAEALDIADQVAQGLESAHAQKVVHRDIKPQNILIAEDGTVKVTDFGIAYAATSGTLVNTGSLLGTVQYLSPEQARGKIVGPQSDLYSLGIVLFEMLTGKLPFEADSPIGVAIKHLQDEAPEVTTLRPDIPAPVAKIVRRALSKDPAERYQTAQAMRQDIQRALDPEAPAMLPPPAAPEAPKSPARKKRRWLPWAIAAAILVLVAGAGIAAFDHWIYTPVVTLPNVKGQSLTSAKTKLGRLGLTVSVTGKAPSSDLPRNYVLNEIPAAGTQIKAGQAVEVVVSTGPQQVSVPRPAGPGRCSSGAGPENGKLESRHPLRQEHQPERAGGAAEPAGQRQPRGGPVCDPVGVRRAACDGGDHARFGRPVGGAGGKPAHCHECQRRHPHAHLQHRAGQHDY